MQNVEDLITPAFGQFCILHSSFCIRPLRPYFQRHRHLLKRLCTLAHESLTEYLRTALGCPEGVPGIIMTLHTFGEYSILLNSAVDTREQVR